MERVKALAYISTGAIIAAAIVSAVLDFRTISINIDMYFKSILINVLLAFISSGIASQILFKKLYQAKLKNEGGIVLGIYIVLIAHLIMGFLAIAAYGGRHAGLEAVLSFALMTLILGGVLTIPIGIICTSMYIGSNKSLKDAP